MDEWSVAFAIGANIATAVSVLIAAATYYFAKRQDREEQRKFNRTMRASYYSELDKMYFELIKFRMGNPHLSGSVSDRHSSLHEQEYDQYAYMMWNFLETVYDRCLDCQEEAEGQRNPDQVTKLNKDGPLYCTWGPVLDYEIDAHRGWFVGGRRDRFKPPFRKYVDDPRLAGTSPKSGSATEGPLVG